MTGGEAYYTDENQKSYETADGVITDFMFYNCSTLKNVILPSSITSIGKRAFCRTGLSKIDIPNNIISLGYDSFGYCSSLETVIIGNKVSQISQGAFYSSRVKNAYVKVSAPPTINAYLFSSKPEIFQKPCLVIRFVQK
ncbi:leucine-rich repeat domain-containing protein [uncultured Treponema sp.]|uniref:leucine-rich repeat domain-containing protein n=1 Tax=uncultured Treponema sp. TaxID=162155 RepID=UPI0025E642FA|nr:leucine-rich repeat domain-containing protein [uncultured Treponema sp.]